MYKRVYFALSACQAVLKEPNDAPTRLCKYGYRKRWLPWHNIFILFFAKNKSTKQTNKPASTQTHSPTIRHKVASHLLGISLSLKKAFASGSQDNGSNRWKTEKPVVIEGNGVEQFHFSASGWLTRQLLWCVPPERFSLSDRIGFISPAFELNLLWRPLRWFCLGKADRSLGKSALIRPG